MTKKKIPVKCYTEIKLILGESTIRIFPDYDGEIYIDTFEWVNGTPYRVSYV